ncbi:MAG: hypothetical protein Q7R64_03420 [bacterium]|nr:hypothetical protein [bacterium]
MKKQYLIDSLNVGYAVTFTTILGLIPTWMYLLMWWHIPNTSPGKFNILIASGIIWLVLQICVWMFVCLWWDTPAEFDKRVCAILGRVSWILTVLLISMVTGLGMYVFTL